MSPEPADFWLRAQDTLAVAEALLSLSPNSCASRAYYAAFYAVSALFALDGRTFKKHTGVEAAVHKDLVQTGRWSIELAGDYSELARLRMTGDYGGGRHVTPEQAAEAVDRARRIVAAVQAALPLD